MDRSFTLFISISLDPWTQCSACGDCLADTRRALLRLKKEFSLEPKAKSAGYWMNYRHLPLRASHTVAFLFKWGRMWAHPRAPGRVRIEISSFLPLGHLDAYPPNSLWATLCNFPSVIIPQSSCPFCPCLMRAATALVTRTVPLELAYLSFHNNFLLSSLPSYLAIPSSHLCGHLSSVSPLQSHSFTLCSA